MNTAPKQAAAHTPLDLGNLSQFDGHAPGPWDADPNDREWDGSVRGVSGVIVCVPEQHVEAADANTMLIAAAPALLAECLRQREQIQALREALEKLVQFAGSDWAYKYPPDQWDAYPPDCIIEARAALKVSE